jgi:hypothetical protein
MKAMKLHAPAIACLSLIFASACASTRGGASEPSPREARLSDWNNVTKLSNGIPIRVTTLDGERSYGRVMSATSQGVTLELEASSVTLARETVALVERFPASFPNSVPRVAVGVGAALSLSSSSSPATYRRSVAPAHEILDKTNEHTRNGYYVDTVELVGRTAQMVDRAIESTRRTVVVYRAR